MTRTRPALLLLWALSLPLSAVESPIAVETRSIETRSIETRSIETRSIGEEIPFREPIIDEPQTSIEHQYQLQILQQEVGKLHGLIEELTHEVSQMKGRQEDRYLELDARFQDFKRKLSEARPRNMLGTPIADMSTNDDSMADQDISASQNEKILYDTGLELTRNFQYDLAVTQFRAVISRYPDGFYTPNAYYWLGEIYAARPDPDYEAARQALAQVISFFPNHRKVPDAAFKLGKVYHLMGDCDRARELLTQVMEQHRGRSVAKLAESYLRDKVSCEP